MKVLVTPPGKESRYPLIIRLIMFLPIAKHRRWRLQSRAIKRLKPLLRAFHNLPARMPDDFAFTYDRKVLKHHESKRVTVRFGKDVRNKEAVANSAKLPDLDSIPETIVAFTAEQRQQLYIAIRKLGFIHFETIDNIEVSYDFTVHTDYKLTCAGREYSYSCSTTEPTRLEWSEEEIELDTLVNKKVREVAKVQ